MRHRAVWLHADLTRRTYGGVYIAAGRGSADDATISTVDGQGTERLGLIGIRQK